MTKTELPIATPCNADWSAMDPRDTGRFCGECQKIVHDLSALRETAARALLASKGAGLCIRYLHDEHGNVWFQEQLVARQSLLRRAGQLAAVALAPMLTACMGPGPDDEWSDAAQTAHGDTATPRPPAATKPTPPKPPSAARPDAGTQPTTDGGADAAPTDPPADPPSDPNADPPADPHADPPADPHADPDAGAPCR